MALTASDLSVALPKEANELVQLYRRMVRVRLCEEALAKSHQRGLIHGACHTYVGQEAIAVGVCAHLNVADQIFSTHRGRGHPWAKGLERKQLFAELYGGVTVCFGSNPFAKA